MYNVPYSHCVKRPIHTKSLKAAVPQLLKKKLTVNTGPVMFSEEIYFSDSLIQLTNRW